MSYTLYGGVRSRAFRAIWLLEELGQPFDLRAVAPQSPELRAVSPLGKIPVLVDGADVIPDSSAILTYLADKHDRFGYAAGTVKRARQDAWTFRILDELDAVLWTAARHTFVLPEEARVPAVKEACKMEYARNIDRIMDEMTGPYLMGDEMTVPDIILCHCGGWAQSAKFPDAPAGFADYLARLRARPAFQAALARAT